MSTRDDILNRIANCKSGNFEMPEVSDWVSEELNPILGDPIEVFKREMLKVNGECYVVETAGEAGDMIKTLNLKYKVAQVNCDTPHLMSDLGLPAFENRGINDAHIVLCEYLVARTGSVVVSSITGEGRRNNVFPPVLFVIARVDQLVPYLDDALQGLKKRYRKLPDMISVITGPSRTADIEKTLVMGAHGPQKLIVLILSETKSS